VIQSPLRVHSQEEADFVYLPFYAALECRLSQAAEGDAHTRAYQKRVSPCHETVYGLGCIPHPSDGPWTHRTGLMLLLDTSVCQSAHDVSDLML
jgi:hypothetical protein